MDGMAEEQPKSWSTAICSVYDRRTTENPDDMVYKHDETNLKLVNQYKHINVK